MICSESHCELAELVLSSTPDCSKLAFTVPHAVLSVTPFYFLSIKIKIMFFSFNTQDSSEAPIKWGGSLNVFVYLCFTNKSCFQSRGNYQRIKRGSTKLIRLLIELREMERKVCLLLCNTFHQPENCTIALQRLTAFQWEAAFGKWNSKLKALLFKNKLTLHNNAPRAGPFPKLTKSCLFSNDHFCGFPVSSRRKASGDGIQSDPWGSEW